MKWQYLMILLEIANKYRTQMLEAVSDVDDTLLEKYLEGKEISAA